MDRQLVRGIARQRIAILLKMADEIVKKDEQLARRYVELALKIASKARIRIPKDLRRKYCRGCNIPLVPGVTSRVRVKRGCGGTRIIVTCLRCGYVRRYPVKKHGGPAGT